MIYIKKIINQDLEKEIAFPKGPSNLAFNYDCMNPEEPYHYYDFIFKTQNSAFLPYSGTSIENVRMRQHWEKSESKITKELANFLKDKLHVQEGDLLIFSSMKAKPSEPEKSRYAFDLIPQTNTELYNKYDYFMKDNHVIFNDDEQTEEVKMKERKPFQPLNYKPFDKTKKTISYNRIIFGAPGTGKSFELKHDSEFLKKDGTYYEYNTKEEERTELTFPKANVERVTFHPDYSYGQFIGSYKPVSDDDGRISYEYVPGPFMRTLVSAFKSGKTENPEKFLLIIEEINRSKVAAVFGDMFQLLDRTNDGDSVYEIQTSEDVRRYLADALDSGTKDDYKSIKLPNNMYIWATMNSADQGVFPMDTAFKRRWDFSYLDINANETKISIDKLPVKIDESTKEVSWNILRKSINSMLLRECKVNEDKLLGPFFISGDVFKNATQGNNDEEKKKNIDAFYDAFNSKLLMYLFEDAGKMHQKKLFGGISDKAELTFSKVCEEFKANGTAIFGSAFQLVK